MHFACQVVRSSSACDRACGGPRAGLGEGRPRRGVELENRDGRRAPERLRVEPRPEVAKAPALEGDAVVVEQRPDSAGAGAAEVPAPAHARPGGRRRGAEKLERRVDAADDDDDAEAARGAVLQYRGDEEEGPEAVQDDLCFF